MITGNESAIPIAYEKEFGSYGQKMLVANHGLTIRQHFAAMAMQAALTCDADIQMSVIRKIIDLPPDAVYEYPKHYMQYQAKIAVEAADAIINELNKKP